MRSTDNITYICGPNRINIIDTSNVTAPAYVGEFGDADLTGNGGKCAINSNSSLSRADSGGHRGTGQRADVRVVESDAPQSPVKMSPAIHHALHVPGDLSFLGTIGYASTSWFETSGNSITAQHGDFVAYDFSSLFPVLLSVLSSGPGSAT